MTAVFVDFDGTITDLDTLDVLIQYGEGAAAWSSLEADLAAGRITLRETLERQAAYVAMSLDDADDILVQRVRFDPTFVPFVAQCESAGHTMCVVSSGIAPLIRRALGRNGVEHVALVANDVDAHANGWRMRFAGDSHNGTDKAALVRAARDAGHTTVFVGDGWSDVEAAREADVRFAKRGRNLERSLNDAGLAFTPFARFSDIDPTTFP